MKRFIPGLLAGVCAALLFVPAFTQDAHDAGADDLAAMMAKAKQFTQPGEHHKELTRFIGKWSTETRITMTGYEAPAEKGTAEFSWLMPDRWIKGEVKGTLMGMPCDGFYIVGYDNFKQSFVATHVTNFDTSMNHGEGDIDPATKALVLYSTVDEYLTGEVGKMAKAVWRFPSADKLVMELHDLAIGEQNTKVVEVVYTRAK